MVDMVHWQECSKRTYQSHGSCKGGRLRIYLEWTVENATGKDVRQGTLVFGVAV